MNGRSLLTRSLEAISSSGVASAVVVVAPEEFLVRAREEISAITENGESGMSITAVAGGSDRTSSVQIALKYVGDVEFVLVHDAARCLTPPEVFRRVLTAVRSGAEAVVPVLPMTDTVRPAVAKESAQTPGSGRGVDEIETAGGEGAGPSGAAAGETEILRGACDRTQLRRVQTPQGFRADTLRRAHEQHRSKTTAATGASGDPTGGPATSDGAAATDDAGLVERLGCDVVAVAGDEEAFKITYPLDLLLGEQLARLRDESPDVGPGGTGPGVGPGAVAPDVGHTVGPRR